MTDFYYILNSLPEIDISKEVPIKIDDLMMELEMNLSDKDRDRIRAFSRYYDVLNLKAYWQQKTLDPWGNLDTTGIEEALLVENILPEFVFDFLKDFGEDKDRIKNFPKLLSGFLSDRIEQEKGFLQSYFLFQKTIRLLITIVKAGSEKEELEKKLFFEDFQDIRLREMIKNTDTYEDVCFDYRLLVKILKDKSIKPLELYKKFMEFQFYALDDQMIEHPFSMDQLLGYLAKLRIVTELNTLDDKTGKEIVSKIA